MQGPFAKYFFSAKLSVLTYTYNALVTRSSAVTKRPRDDSCLSVVSFNSTKRQAQSFIVNYN